MEVIILFLMVMVITVGICALALGITGAIDENKRMETMAMRLGIFALIVSVLCIGLAIYNGGINLSEKPAICSECGKEIE